MAPTMSSFSWGAVLFVLKNVFLAFSGLGRHIEGAVGFGHFGGAIENFQVGPKNAQIASELRSKCYTFFLNFYHFLKNHVFCEKTRATNPKRATPSPKDAALNYDAHRAQLLARKKRCKI